MPKSTHRRKGKPRPRRGNQHPGPVFTYRGQRFRGVAQLPRGYDLHTLEARYGDDPAAITLALLRAALGDNAVEQIINDDNDDNDDADTDHTDTPAVDGTLDVEAIVPLVDQICDHYFGDMLASWITQRLPGGRGAGP